MIVHTSCESSYPDLILPHKICFVFPRPGNKNRSTSVPAAITMLYLSTYHAVLGDRRMRERKYGGRGGMMIEGKIARAMMALYYYPIIKYLNYVLSL